MLVSPAMGNVILGAIVALVTVRCERRRRELAYLRWEQAFWQGFARELRAARGG